MFKKRMLLLVASLAAFGAIMVGGAFANPESTVSTNGSGAVYAKAPVGVAQLVDTASVIPATGVAFPVGTLQASDNDSDYNVQVKTATLNLAGWVSTCAGGAYSTVAILSLPNTGDLTPDNAWQNVATLNLAIPIANSAGCYSYGAYYDVVFEAI